MRTPRDDPWAAVEDIEGTGHYTALGLKPTASAAEVRAAFRQLARLYHPDKGGTAAKFTSIQKAFEVLADPKSRQTYDLMAKELRYRFIPGVSARAPGGEDVLLDEFARMGVECDAETQLVVLCEVCGRPSTKICYACELRFCDFCTRKQHWKGSVGLHWPIVNTPHMRDRLGMKEMEKKRLEDAKRYLMQDPHYRTEAELQDIRLFQAATAAAAARGPAGDVINDPAVTRYYMWAQTPHFVYVAVFVPTGKTGDELEVEIAAGEVLHIGIRGMPPAVHRRLAGALDRGHPMETFLAEDRRLVLCALPKAAPAAGETAPADWRALFEGDSDGARCLASPYRLAEGVEDIALELELPPWVRPKDVTVAITLSGLHIRVAGGAGASDVAIDRRFWVTTDERRASDSDYTGVVDPKASCWDLGDVAVARGGTTLGVLRGERCRVLAVSLARPARTHEEITWKKGVRQDHRVAERRGEGHTGYRLFDDDEDHYALEDPLQALIFLETGSALVPAKPWSAREETRVARRKEDLSEGARRFLDVLSKTDETC